MKGSWIMLGIRRLHIMHEYEKAGTDESTYDLLYNDNPDDFRLTPEKCCNRLSMSRFIYEVIDNYSVMTEEEKSSYFREFYFQVKNKKIPIKENYIEYFLACELIRKLMDDIEHGKIPKSERLTEIYCLGKGIPKYYPLMKMLPQRHYIYFYQRYFRLVSLNSLEKDYGRRKPDNMKIAKHICFLFKDEKAAFYAAHYNYKYMINRMHRIFSSIDKAIRNYRSREESLVRFFGFRILGTIAGTVISIILYYVFLNS